MFQDSLTKKIAEAAAKIKTEVEIVDVNEKSVEGAVSKIMSEKLVGDQHKIDANKNNKVDAHDFKLLRAQKDKEKANSQKFGKDVKEETEQIDEISLDLAKRARDKAEHIVDMDYDDLRMKPFGHSEKQRVKFQKYVDKKEKMKKEETEIDEAMFPGTKEYEKKYGQSPQQKLKKVGDTEKTAQGEMKKTEKGVMHTRRFSEMISAYQEEGLKYINSLVKEEPSQEEFEKEVEEQKDKMDGKKKGGDVAKASVQAVKNEETEIQVINADIANGVKIDNIEERSLTEPEMKKKEEIVKSMKKGMAGFKKRYGDRAKEVMYATAAKIAKEKA